MTSRTILDPIYNHGVNVTVCRRTRYHDSFGEIQSHVDKTDTIAIWAELGYESRRTKDGGKYQEIVEAHLYPEFGDLVPGRDYIIKDGVNYRITARLGMERMVGVVMYELTREVGHEP